MENAQNPFGLHTVTPYLIVYDVKKLVDFIMEVFDAKSRGDLSYRKDGSVQHAEIKIGDSVIMLGEPLEEINATRSTLYVYVKNCDETFEKALQLGGESVLQPQNFPHGDRYGGVKDFAGNIWWIVTHIGQKEHRTQ